MAAAVGRAPKPLPPPSTPFPPIFLSFAAAPGIFLNFYLPARINCIHPLEADTESIPEGSPAPIYKPARVYYSCNYHCYSWGWTNTGKRGPVCVDLLSWNISGVVCESNPNRRQENKEAQLGAESGWSFVAVGQQAWMGAPAKRKSDPDESLTSSA